MGLHHAPLGIGTVGYWHSLSPVILSHVIVAPAPGEYTNEPGPHVAVLVYKPSPSAAQFTIRALVSSAANSGVRAAGPMSRRPHTSAMTKS
jgi:hypothetical protein